MSRAAHDVLVIGAAGKTGRAVTRALVMLDEVGREHDSQPPGQPRDVP